MGKKLPDIAISFVNKIPAEVFGDFTKAIQAEGLDLRIEKREPEKFFLSLDWMIPTAVILYIAKSYFDGFLGEMGKEHYGILRKRITALWAQFFGSDRVVPQGRLMVDGEILRTEYTHTFSILVQSKDGRLIKLMLKEEISQQEYEDATDAFLNFIERHHNGVNGADIPKQFCFARDCELFSQQEYEEATNAFLTFIERHHAGINGADIPKQFCFARDCDLFVSYDADRKEIQFLDIHLSKSERTDA